MKISISKISRCGNDGPDKLRNYHFGFYLFGFPPWWCWGGWRWCNLGLLLRANKGCLFSIADLLSLSAALMPLCFNLINIQGDEDGCTDWYLYLLAQIDRQADKAIYSEKLSGGEVGESESESGGNQLQTFTLLISRYRAARDKGTSYQFHIVTQHRQKEAFHIFNWNP